MLDHIDGKRKQPEDPALTRNSGQDHLVVQSAARWVAAGSLQVKPFQEVRYFFQVKGECCFQLRGDIQLGLIALQRPITQNDTNHYTH